MAASHFFYNGEQIDTHDGTKGVIVSRIQHDSSASVSVDVQEYARRDGLSVQDRRLRGKRIELSGAVIGTDKQDFEQRLAALKHLFATPSGKLKVTNYGTHEHTIASFESGEAWSGGAVETVTVRTGVMARSVTADSGGGAQETTWTATHDVSAFDASDTIKLWAHVSDGALLTSVALTLTTSGGNYYQKTWTGLASGWNELSVAVSGMTVTGSPSLGNITSIALTVAAATVDPVSVVFDSLRIVATDDSMTYDVVVDREISLPREAHHITWCRFSVSMLCPSGVAVSEKATSLTLPGGTATQQFLPLHLGGSGAQDVRLAVSLGDSEAGSVSVADHFLDRFGDASPLERYTTEGAATWGIASVAGRPTALSVTGVGGAAWPTGVTFMDGEIIALVRVSAVKEGGVFARGSSGVTGSYVKANANSGLLTDDLGLSVGDATVTTAYDEAWKWVRLVCVGTTARVYVRDEGDDDWTLTAEAPCEQRSGSWGVWNQLNTAFGHVELIDYATGQRNTISINRADPTSTGAHISSATYTATLNNGYGPLAGSFPSFPAGRSVGSVSLDGAMIGSPTFYEVAARQNGMKSFGGITNNDIALKFNSGPSSFIRRRGTFIYVARLAGPAATGDLKAYLYTWGAGEPDSLLSDVHANSVIRTIPFEEITARLAQAAGSPSFNASVVPFEIIWDAEIAVTPNTDYALVLKAATDDNLRSFYMPYDDGAASEVAIYQDGGTGSWTNTGDYAFLRITGDGAAPSGSPWSVRIGTTPQYQ